MTTLAKSVLFGLLVVAAVVAVLFGLRRRGSTDPGRRGVLAGVRAGFYAAVALVLGGSTACVSGTPDDSEAADSTARDADAATDFPDTCYIPIDEGGREDAWTPPEAADEACYAETGLLDDAWMPPDADVPDADPQADAEDVPDSFDLDAVTCYQIGPDPDAASSSDADPDVGHPEALIGLGPAERARRIRWARRTLERARAVRRILADPRTEPAVRAVLRADLKDLSRHVRLAGRFLRPRSGGTPPIAGQG